MSYLYSLIGLFFTGCNLSGVSLKILLLFSLIVFSGTEVCAQKQERKAGEKLYIKNASQLIAKSPGGRKMGEIYLNTPVELVEDGEEWSKVNITAWVRSSSLVARSKKKRVDSKSRFSDGVIKIVSISSKVVSEGLPIKRVYLTLNLTNTSKRAIYSWSALLVAKQNGKILFREAISDDTKPIEPGSLVEVNFYWEPDEKPYSFLLSGDTEEIDFTLYRVAIKR